MLTRVRSIHVPDPAAAPPLRLVPAQGAVAIGLHGFALPDSERPLTEALYAYPTAHDAFWRMVRFQARVAPLDSPLPPGCFDEHLALEGIAEADLWLGDLLRFPDCTLVVGAPRLPDARFNESLGFAQAADMVAQSGWCGCWLAVRRPGRLAPGDPFELLPGPRATGLVELFRARRTARAR